MLPWRGGDLLCWVDGALGLAGEGEEANRSRWDAGDQTGPRRMGSGQARLLVDNDQVLPAARRVELWGAGDRRGVRQEQGHLRKICPRIREDGGYVPTLETGMKGMQWVGVGCSSRVFTAGTRGSPWPLVWG